MQPFEAMRLARERGLDVVEISPTADPPVCKITDYGKYLYQESKRKHEARRHQKGSQLKEVKFRPSTAEHDYQVRKNQIVRFLGEGHKVKAMIFHRGREMAHQEVSRGKMDRLLKEINEYALVELGPRMEANILMALLAPKKGAPAARTSRGAAAKGVATSSKETSWEGNSGEETEDQDSSWRRKTVQGHEKRQDPAHAFRQASYSSDEAV